MIVWLQERVNDMLSQELRLRTKRFLVNLKTNNVSHGYGLSQLVSVYLT